MRKGNRQQSGIHAMAAVAVMTALTCVLAPLSVPVGAVPLSFVNLVIYLSVFLLGWKAAAAGYIVYMCIGLVGLPVFSGFHGGAGVLLGPTGGYILGWLPAIVLMGAGSSRMARLFALLGGTAVCYAAGTAWFCTITDTPLAAALGICVLPFILGDLAKIAVVLAVGPTLKEKLKKAKVLPAGGSSAKC